MSVDKLSTLDENSRRYYLDAMGIQCWESLYDSTSENVIDAANTETIVAAGAVASVDVSEATLALQALESDIQQCKKCQLHATRKQAVCGRGNHEAALMFVLLSPDNNDVATNTAGLCSGEAFELFSKMLAAINVPIDGVYITSLLKCYVPALHTVSTGEINHCKDYLKQQIRLVQPELLIVLGDTSARCMFQKDVELDTFRNEMNINDRSAMTCFDNVATLVSYSPQELLQNAENKRKAWADLKLIQQILNQPAS